ncbi:MAG: hypothetical protein AB1567_12575 [bacterium]
MVLKINFAIAIIFSFINGIITFCKFYNYISSTELLLLIFLRVLITFILFFGFGVGIYFFLKQQVPELFTKLRIKKPVSTKVDYILPSISPTTSTLVKEATTGESGKKETLPDEIAKAEPESLAMVIRTMMAEE